ncbi:MAG: NHL repeat-containing protein, partial [Planctomycetota bacterium]
MGIPVLAVLMALAGAAAAGTYDAPLDARKTADAKFAAEPKASKAGGTVKISFTAGSTTDVEVAVLGAKGNVVRHLAAGLLGKNAPAPLKKASLTQELVWDGKDDFGKPAAGGPFKARVRLGSRPKLERHMGWNGNALGGPGTGLAVLAVGKGGEVFVADNVKYGRTGMKVYDRDGKYVRTIMPYPADTPKQRLEGVGQLVIEGQGIPLVSSGVSGNVYPMITGLKRQTAAFSPRGHLVMASALGTIMEHGPPRHFLALDPRGGAPEGMSFVGPKILEPRGALGGAGEKGADPFEQLAVGPKGEYIYFSTSHRVGKAKKTHGVYRVKWTAEKLGKPWLGAVESGTDDAHFNDPKGLATDKGGNVYACDRGNNRVMIFSSEARLLGKFSVNAPAMIAV